ncbi:hypothetical protein DF3PB_10084 [uncultured Defluviicoccus sp.]|uniref:Uncharacterized protein n=1 Tax=metagenome TaxID=256318 RepID=A0A380T8B5_9ZZZZ|nr:hypothetical protein DF3PB_10084 [uncultured Defluviicoccus sp.]
MVPASDRLSLRRTGLRSILLRDYLQVVGICRRRQHIDKTPPKSLRVPLIDTARLHWQSQTTLLSEHADALGANRIQWTGNFPPAMFLGPMRLLARGPRPN